MNKNKEYYLNLLEKLAVFLSTSKEPMFFHKVQFCELTKNTNKTYIVTVCVSAFEDLPLINFDGEDEWYWDPITGAIKLIEKPDLDPISAVIDYFSLHSDVFKHFFCLNSQLKKYGTTTQLNEESALAEIAENIQTYIKQERSQYEQK